MSTTSTLPAPRTKGARTRQAILDAAIDMASAHGLEGLTFGKLAARLSMSKSGLFAHFPSKTALQLGALDAAQERFVDAVVRPVLAEPRGLPRLWRLCAEWLRYARGDVFEGGCFFAAAAAEFDNRPGPVRERIVELAVGWTEDLRKAIEIAQGLGHVSAELDVDQLAFELHALMAAANSAHQLVGGAECFDRAWTAIRTRIVRALTPQAPRLPGLQP